MTADSGLQADATAAPAGEAVRHKGLSESWVVSVSRHRFVRRRWCATLVYCGYEDPADPPRWADLTIAQEVARVRWQRSRQTAVDRAREQALDLERFSADLVDQVVDQLTGSDQVTEVTGPGKCAR